MKRISLLLSAFLIISLLLYLPAAKACDWPELIITDGLDISKLELYNLEFIWEGYPCESLCPPTRVDMTGGHVGNSEDWNSGMFTYESSTFNVSGGIVDYLRTYNSSTVNISGGIVSNYDCMYDPTILTYDFSTINVYDGALLFGGSFHMFELYDSSTLNVYGGDVSLFLLAYNSSIVNIYDGRCSFAISPYDYSTVNVYGGHIDTYLENVSVPETATVNIYGYGFHYNPKASWGYWEDPCDGWWVSILTGHGCDGRPITYWGLPDLATHPNINLIPDFIPGRGVDLADFAILASAWRSNPGDENWNPICDISDPNDNVIDERDLAILTKYWLAGVE